MIDFYPEPPYGDTDFFIIFQLHTSDITQYHHVHIIYNYTLYEVWYQSDNTETMMIMGRKQTKIDQETIRCIIAEAVGMM